MSTARTADDDADAETDSDANAPDPADVAATLREARFVRLRIRADGDALAAGGLLARALRSHDAGFHARVRPDPTPERDDADDTVTVTVGGAPAATGCRAVPGRDAGRPASATAFAVARDLGADPDPVLALAGAVAAGTPPDAAPVADAFEAAQNRSLVERRPGVAVPTADLADGLAHSTLLRAPFSGDPEAAAATLAEASLPTGRDVEADVDTDADARRRLASIVALTTAGTDRAASRAAESVGRALRPYATPADASPFTTLGGYADVLDAVARERPGVGVALALAGADADEAVRTAALTAWRDHARATHRTLDAARRARHRGVVVARVDADDDAVGRPAVLPTAARLLASFESPEPTVLVVSPAGAVAARAPAADATVDADLGDAVAEAAAEVGGRGRGDATHGAARFDARADRDGNGDDAEGVEGGETDTERFIAAVREAL